MKTSKKLLNYLSKMLPRLCSPPTPSWMGLSYGVPPSLVLLLKGAPMRSCFNFCIWSLVGAFLLLTKRSPARFRAKFVYVLFCCKFTFSVSKFGKRVELVLFLMSFNLKLFTDRIF